MGGGDGEGERESVGWRRGAGGEDEERPIKVDVEPTDRDSFAKRRENRRGSPSRFSSSSSSSSLVLSSPSGAIFLRLPDARTVFRLSFVKSRSLEIGRAHV